MGIFVVLIGGIIWAAMAIDASNTTEKLKKSARDRGLSGYCDAGGKWHDFQK